MSDLSLISLGQEDFLIIKESGTREESLHTERLELQKYVTKDVATVYDVCLKESKKIIGWIAIFEDDAFDEICYLIDEPFRNRGYCTEAVLEILKHNSDKTFYLIINKGNIASKKVAQKLGFVYDSRAKCYYNKKESRQ